MDATHQFSYFSEEPSPVPDATKPWKPTRRGCRAGRRVQLRRAMWRERQCFYDNRD